MSSRLILFFGGAVGSGKATKTPSCEMMRGTEWEGFSKRGLSYPENGSGRTRFCKWQLFLMLQVVPGKGQGAGPAARPRTAR